MRGRGNIRLRGKRRKLLGCGCCEAWDGRWECRRKEDERDMREAAAALDEGDMDGFITFDELKLQMRTENK